MLGKLARQRRSAGEHDPQRRRVVLRARLLRQLEDAAEHDRHDRHYRRPVVLHVLECQFRVEAVLEHDRRAQRRRDHVLADSPRVEQRRDDEVVLADVVRDPSEQAADGVQALGRTAVGALRRPGRPGGQDDELRLLARRDDVGAVTRLDQVLEGLVACDRLVVADPGHVAPGLAALRSVVDQLRELGVVDRDPRLLTLEHVARLRRRERRVQVQGACAELRARERRLDEVAVIAREDRDPVALDDASIRQRVRERVAAPVDLLEGQLAEVVDQADLVRVAHRARRGRRGRRRAPVDQDVQHPHKPVGPLEPDETGARQRVERVQLRLDLLLERQPHPQGKLPSPGN